MASLSTYILNNPTTPASENFNKVSSKIIQNLLDAERILKQNISSEIDKNPTDEEDIFEATFGRKKLFSENKKTEEDDFHSKIEEAHLVREQLKWLLAMSEKMPKLLRETQF